MSNAPYLKPFFIGLAGPDGVGKSTVQQAIENLDWRDVGAPRPDIVVRHMSFAKRLYACLSTMVNVPVAEMKARKNEVFTAKTAPTPGMVGKSYRWLLRNFATEFIRDKLHGDFWVHAVLEEQPKIQESEYSKMVVVVLDDLRFVNECGICDLRIELNRTGVSYDGEHASSKGLPKYVSRLDVNNDGVPKDAAQVIARAALDRFTCFQNAGAKRTRDRITGILKDYRIAHGNDATRLLLPIREEFQLYHELSQEDLLIPEVHDFGLRQWVIAKNNGKLLGLDFDFAAHDLMALEKPVAA